MDQSLLDPWGVDSDVSTNPAVDIGATAASPDAGSSGGSSWFGNIMSGAGQVLQTGAQLAPSVASIISAFKPGSKSNGTNGTPGKATLTTPSKTNWLLIGAIALGVLVIGFLTFKAFRKGN